MLSGTRTPTRSTTFFASEADWALAVERSFYEATFRQPSKFRPPNHATVATWTRLELRRAQVRGT